MSRLFLFLFKKYDRRLFLCITYKKQNISTEKRVVEYYG